MTIDFTQLLDSLTPSDNFDSLLDEVAEAARDEGIDIFGVYCLHTGKVIGQFAREEILFALRDEPSDSIDDLVSAMMVRVVAAMRPSPALNKPDALTLRSLATRRPVDIMAYLVNRLNGTRQLLTKRSDESFSPLIGRIATYNRVLSLQAAGVDLTPWIHWLLELDSKMNLHDLTPPIVKMAPLNRLLFDQLTPTNHAEMLKLFESWAFEQLRAFDKRDAQITREANWIRGNAFTKPAYVRSWMENPGVVQRKEIANNKLQAIHDKKLKPGRPVSEKTQERRNKLNQMLALLDEVLDGKSDTAPAAPAPVTPKLKLNLVALAAHAKKES